MNMIIVFIAVTAVDSRQLSTIYSTPCVCRLQQQFIFYMDPEEHVKSF